MTRMLILTALTREHGFSRDVYRRFAGSLAATGFDGNITIMTTCEEIRDGELSILQDEIHCLTFSPMPRMEEERDINCYRYRHFYEFLKPRTQDYEYVMLSDSCDVIFQRDISQYPFTPETDLFFAEEEKLIGDCPFNAGWILDLYGPACLSQLKNRTVLCSGTTIGLPQAVLSYLEAIIEQIDAVDEEFHRRFGYLGGIDQGIHNYLHYRNMLPDLKIRTVPNRENMVYTIGHVAHDDWERQFLDAECRFINQQGELCYCIHQFDRLDVQVLEAFNRNSHYAI